MNVLKHGSKLVSVGLLSLSLSAGFSGLAFARIPQGVLTDIPNSTVLGGNAALDTASDRDLSTGVGLAPSSPSTATTTPFPGQFTGTTTPSTGITQSFPGQFTGQFNKTTSGRFAGTTTPRQSGEAFFGKASRSSQAAGLGQASQRRARTSPPSNVSSQAAGLGQASQRRARTSPPSNVSSQAAGSGQASQRRTRTSPPSNVSSQAAGSGQASQRRARTNPPTNAASQNSDELLRGLIDYLDQ